MAWLKYAVILIVCSAALAWCQRIGAEDMTAQDLREQGISIVLPNAPEFLAESNRLGFSNSSGFRAVRPFSAIVINRSGRSVVAAALRWTLANADGNTTTHDVMFTQYSGLLDDGKSRQRVDPNEAQIRSGASRLFSLVGMVRGYENLADATERLQTRPAKSVVSKVEVDVVIFDDGTALGPNHTGLIERFKAHVDGQQDLMEEISGRLKTGETLHTILIDLQNKSGKNRDDVPPLSPSDVYFASRKQYLQELVTTDSYAGEEAAKQAFQKYKYKVRPRIQKAAEENQGARHE